LIRRCARQGVRPPLKRKVVRSRPMGYDRGAHATYCGQKCLSISTGTQADGTHEFLVNGLAGPGVERHVHGWATIAESGELLAGGARLKNASNSHVGNGLSLSAAGQEIARVTVTPTDAGVVTMFSQLEGGTWLETSDSTHGGSIQRTEVPLPGAEADAPTQYSIEMFDARTGVPSNSSTQAVVAFSGSVPFGLVFRHLLR